jgi:carotenoid cleavage dioxygenase-like enzyme
MTVAENDDVETSPGSFVTRGNYAPVADELTEFDLPVTGTIPPELDGWYIRNGPNPRDRPEHWFTGDGMVHGVRIENGRAAWYRNRWVRTQSFDRRFPVYNRDGSRNLHSSVANTHVVHHAGKTLALMEVSLPYEITTDLATVGVYDFGGKLADSMTAHPKICPITSELHFFGYGNIFEPHVSYYRVDSDGDLVVSRPVEVPALTMMHDFAMTADHIVFLDLPVVFDLERASRARSMPFRWDDDYGARLGVMRRNDPYGEIRWFDVDPCYVFHVANAYDKGDAIVLHVIRYPELWRANAEFEQGDSVLWAWSIDLRRGVVTERQLDDHLVEFPRIDDRRAGLPARHAVAVGTTELLRYELESGARAAHSCSNGRPGEVVFVPSHTGAADETNGWYLGFVYRPDRATSDLVIIDASDFTGPPVASIALPQRVPYGFHGNWIPGG